MKQTNIQKTDSPLQHLVIRAYYPDVDGMHIGYAVSKALIVLFLIDLAVLLIALGVFVFGHVPFSIGAVLLIPMLILGNATYHQIKTTGRTIAPALIFVDGVFLLITILFIVSGKLIVADIVLLLFTLIPGSLLYHEIKAYSGYYELDAQGKPVNFLSHNIFIDKRPVNRRRFLQSIQ